LFMQEKVGGDIIQYQVFIEPKGTNLIENDEWKETFLLQMKDRAKAKEILWENYEFRIIGLPFFNHEIRVKEFDEAMAELKNM
jgi:type III restriction enzyme